MNRENVENIYRLTPVQQGMLFHTLYAPGEGFYFQQVNNQFDRSFDPAVFQGVWREMVAANAVLRTSFLWEGLEEPVQVVQKRAEIPFEEQDWRGLPEEERQERLQELLAADRRRGFDLARAPLMRFTLLRMRDDLYHLVWSCHHLLLDGWSSGLLLKEVLELYRAAAAGRPAQPQQRRPFRDYIAWLRQQDLGKAEAYWRRLLGGFTAPTPLGIDRPAGPGHGEDSGRDMKVAWVPEAQSDGLKELARKNRLTVSTLVQGAWALVLSRYSGADDLVFGVTVSGRPPSLPGIELTLGCFINTLPVRVRVPAGETVLPWLQALQGAQVEMRNYEHSPLVKVTGWSDVPRPTPLFESIFVFEGFAEQTSREGVYQRTGYPLTLVAGPDREILMRIEYERERFEPAAIERLLGHLKSVLLAFLERPGQRLDEIDVLTPEERRQIAGWAATAVRYEGADRLLHEIIAARVAARPEAVAVVFGEASLTYRELDERAGRLARRLRGMGVGPEVLAGVCAERSLEMVVALLAVLKAGGAYVPLDPSYPADRLAYMLEDSRVPVLLTQRPLRGRLPATDARVVLLDAEGEEPDAEAPAVAVAPDNAAYMIYTSGSTGRPKGAINTHRAIVNRLLWMQAELGLDATDRVLQKTPFSFDVSVWEFFWPLMMGARLVVAKPGGHQDPDYLVEEIARQGVTTLHFVPSMLQVFLEARGLAQCASLRRVVCSGEALPAELARRYHEVFTAPLINLYGPTEAAVDVSCWRCVPGDPRATVPIGHPVANTELPILDRAGRRAPVGVAGELLIGGVQVGRGYHRRPELTAERFVPDPFGRRGARLYRTGDLARYLPDGAIEFLGRIDHQVKIRGLRIELGEIEAALTADPAVREAVVVATADQRLVGYVVAAAGAAISPAELCAHLALSLPEHMVPAVLVPLDALPLSPNGKVDRRALPAPGAAAGGAAFSAPRTPLEEMIAGIWSEVLKVDRVGRDDNFFELGGHSLRSTRVLSRLRETFQVEVPLRALFEAATVARQAALVESALQTAVKTSMPPLRRVPREGDLALSFSQERFWFIDRMQPGTSAYNIPARLRIEGRLDTPALQGAFAELVRRHEGLRTIFPFRQGRPVQEIRPEAGELPIVDLGGLPEALRERERRALVNRVSHLPFTLATGPLYRPVLLRLEDETHVLLIILHHIVADGWSIGVLVRELGALYAAFSTGKPSPLPEPLLQYADFAVWQREWLQGEVLEAQIDFWRQRLAGSPPVTTFPLDHPRPPRQTHRGNRRGLGLTPELTGELKALGRRQGATLYMLLLAVLDTLLLRYGTQEDLVIGSPIAGRSRVELEGMIGLFLNTLVLRTDASGNPGFAELLDRVRDVTLSAYAHQDLPFEKLVDELSPERNLSHTPFFQMQLVLQNVPLETMKLPGITLSPVASESDAEKLDLTLEAAEPGGGGLMALLRFNPDLFDATTMERLAGHLQRVVETVVSRPECPLREIPLLGEAELGQLREWSATAVAYPSGLLLHRLVEAQVDRAPEAVAVAAGGGALTYRQLDRRANALALRLLEAGVGPEVPVGVCAERSLEMVVALLAVLKAGGGYVPLDPSYPADRLAYMLESAGVSVLLVQPGLLAGLPAHGARVVELAAGGGEEEADRPAVDVDPGGLAYAIFTSGSTGRPKGAMNSHRGIANRLLWMQETFGLDATDRVLQKTPFSFDVSVWEFFWPLMTGARLVMAKPGGHQDPAYLVETIAGEGITTLHFVPSMLQVFLEARGVSQLASLRRVLCSGEALPAELARRFYELLDAPLHNLYGPTEAAVDVSWWPCERGSRPSVPIGRPVANTSLFVLGPEMELPPVGAAGELWIGGAQVGRGYLGRPELTAERFVPDPFGAPGARAYRTGDLARFLADGAIEFLGRIDHQVKIRGFRIELGEIEAALTALPAVREAVVVASRAAGAGGAAVGDWRLIAYVVPAAGAEITVSGLRASLGAVLPEYMIPSLFVVLEALPLNPNGKVDRKALPAPDYETAGAAVEYVPPRTALEKALAEMWSAALGVEVERVGLRDHFFDLGGNSITGAIFVNQLQETLGEIIHVVALFDAPVLESFAAFLVREYPLSVARVWGEEVAAGAAAAPAGPAAEEELDEERLAQIRWHLRKLAPAVLEPVKNPPAVLVLSPPRSGSTLLRVMLGGNPALFAPPELELLNFNTLGERRDAFPGRDAFRLEGLLRAVVEVRGCTPEEARELVERLEHVGATAQEAYALLQQHIAPRLLVDKTPTYAWDPATLQRAEEMFDGALYVHLVRHPYGMIHSFEEARIDQIFFGESHAFDRRELAEALWGIAHRNILDFFKRVPAERQHRVHFEDLLRDPEGVLRGICRFLGVDYHPDMAKPYTKKRERMTDGLYAESRMLGDVKFHEHRRVDEAVAERWREAYTHDFLGAPTWRLAARLGYDVERERVGVAAAVPLNRGGWREGEPLPLSFAQERLWFLDQLDPGTATYNVPARVRLLGRLDMSALRRALGEIVRRHATLRTTFVARQGSPAQIVAAEVRLELPVADLSALPAEARERAVREAIVAHGGAPFDLSRGPLLGALLLREGAEDHVASFVAHHVAYDGWSIGVLLREVAALYAAAVEGRPSPLPELAVQYVDFARWQRQWLEGAAIERQVAYWRERLAGVPVLQLPRDRPRPAVQSYRGSTHGFALSLELSAALRALSRERGATDFMTVLAAFQALLSRYSGQEDFAVGSPVAGRNRRELEPLIGFFVNTLVLRADLAGGPDFKGLLDRVRRTAVDAYAHQDVPFERIVQEIAPERNLSHSPLFQVMLAFQNAPVGSFELPGLTLAPVSESSMISKFDLSLTTFDNAPQIFGQWVFSTALFERETIVRWAGHFQALLEGVAADPGRPVAELPLLTAPEREQLLVEWNRPPADYPSEGFVHRMLEEQAARVPEAAAVIFEGGTLSYHELNGRANRLARRLRRLGVGPESVVGISAERSFEMVVGLLAILKAGGAYLPLDPALPRERLAFMMEDAGIGLLLAQERLLPDLPARAGLGVVPLDGDGEAEESAEDLGVPVDPENAAYVIYTSGSTGQPKGVVVSHRALGNRLQFARAGDVTASDAFLQKTTISFDVSLLEIFAPLVAGGRTVLARPGGQQDVTYLVRLIREQGITYTSFPPSLLYALFAEEGLDRCTTLRTVITGGETVPAVLPGQFYEMLPGADLLNRYGPTEATISVTSWLCERGAPPRTLPIGRPTAKARVYLLDRALQPVPVGMAGEVFLGGLCVARGYLGQPALTAERFVPDPFSGEAGGRLYRTGDLARYRADGAIEFAGRADQQVKIRGFRVELGEIETALARHPAVREVAVIDREDGPTRSLAAYVVHQPGEEADEAELRRFLLEKLPAYMVPADFVTMESLPVAATGKVDRRALPAPSRRGASGEGTPPRTQTEEILAAIWSDLLGVEGIGIEDSFFDLGGHSLLATQAMSRARESFGVTLPLRALFERPTVAGLAEEIEAALRGGSGPGAPPLVPVPREGDLPLSFAQQRLWFLEQLQPGTSTYNMPSAVRFHGALDVGALRRSLREVARRHESLRTTFVVRGGGPVQVVAPEPALDLPVIDLRWIPEGEREEAVRRLTGEEAGRPFDLASEPLIRATLLRSGDDEHVALLTMHHIVSDGWSVGVLVREIATLYPAFLAGRPSPLPELPVQYGDFAVWQRQWLRGEVLEPLLVWWRRALAGYTTLELPTDRPRPAVQRFEGVDEPIAFDGETSRGFLALGRQRGATPYMALLAGFQALMHRYSGQEDVIVGGTLASRDLRELEGLIGFFVNVLPMRADLSGRPTFSELLDRVREVVLGVLSHQEVPFEKLVEAVQPDRDLSRSPLFQVVFQYQQAAAAAAAFELPGLTLSPAEGSGQSAKFDLVLNLRNGAGGLFGIWKLNTDLYDRATVARMSRHLESLLAAAAADPDLPVADLPLLTVAERRELGLEGGVRLAEAMSGGCLHEIFAARAARAPEAVAVTCEGERLSYGELDRRANRLARHLVRLGVAPGDLVGLCLERSLEMVVAVLGVLKAGGAYVPLDPAYPQERLAFMLADSQVPVLLAQESLAGGLPELRAATRVVFLDRDREAIAAESAEHPAVPVTADFPAYVIYTSGSTGKPKGVVVRHGNAARLLTATDPWFGFGAGDVWTLFHSYAFDFSVWEIWGALLYGGRLVVVPYWVSRSPEAFYELLRTERVTVLNQTPSAFRQLIWAEQAALNGAAPDLALRYVVFGGEALEPASLAPWFERHGDERPRLINMYGITETTVHVTYRPIGWREAAGSRSVVGRPIPDLGLYVLDANGQPVPVGVPGEIHVGGAGLALGYLGRPELTAERFVPNPYGEPGSRLYRSGDLARHLAGGDLEYLGRIDHQVKIRGFRVELGEIESALASQPSVREAVVLAREDGAEKRLVAYVVPDGQAPTLPELRDALGDNLPEYMLPSALVVLDRMPLTANGKVDRRALPAPGASPADLEASYVAPGNDLERFLAGLWQEILKVPQTGVRDDFFALGGSSISGAVLVSRLQETLREIVQVVVIFDYPTIAEMSAYLIDQHPKAVERLFGIGAGRRQETAALAGDAELAEFRSLIRPLPPPPRSLRAKNPPAVFVLSPPRSGSTLMRVMLGGHPRLFSPPELELLSFNTLRERRAAFTGRDAFWLEGVVRGVMEIRGCGAAEAEALVEQAEKEDLTTLQFYGRMQEQLGGRVLVDKTPSYALDPAILRRAEEGFEEPRYIHLIRHPLGMVHSFEEAKLDQLFFRHEHPFSRRQLAELIWRASHENIVDFLRGIPAGRQHWVRFEDLLREPEEMLRAICDFLELDYHPDMAEPYKARSARMTDGVHAESRMLGDVKFHQHKGVESGVAERWRESLALSSLGAGTRELAASLGYDVTPEEESGPAIPSVLVGLQPGGAKPPLFLIHPLSGELLMYRQLVAALGPDQPVYGFQALGFSSDEEPLETVEAMAALYVDALLSFQPQGPYLLAGSSLGGLIAFEMARRLRSLQREVAFLGLLDAPDPARFPRLQDDGDGDAEMTILQYVTQGNPPVTLEGLRALDPEARLALILEQGRQEDTPVATEADLAALRRLVRIVRAHRRAVRAYEPQPFDTGLLYVRAAEGLGDDAVWSGLALGGAEVHEVPGNHQSMHYPPNTEALAAVLRAAVDRALRRAEGAPEAGEEGVGRGPRAPGSGDVSPELW